MAYTHDLDCLYSTVKNISGGALKFGFLPPHGQELANDTEVTVFGNILDAVANGFDRNTSRRSVLALEKAIDEQKLEITGTPRPILRESASSQAYMITLASGVLAVDEPCWESTA